MMTASITHNEKNSLLLSSQGRIQLTPRCSFVTLLPQGAWSRALWDCGNLWGDPGSVTAASGIWGHLFHGNEDSGPLYFSHPATNHLEISLPSLKLRRMTWSGESKDLSIYPGNILVLCSELELALLHFDSTHISWAASVLKAPCWAEWLLVPLHFYRALTHMILSNPMGGGRTWLCLFFL